MDIQLAVAALLVLLLAAFAWRLIQPGSAQQGYTCANGSHVASLSDCPEYQKHVCPDGTLVNRAEDCPNCPVDPINASLSQKSHPSDAAMQAATGSALSAFNSSTDNETLFYRGELDANLAAGYISGGDYNLTITAIALYRFVRDNITLLPGAANFSAARDDLTVLSSRSGKIDEKALLYRSLLTANGISSKLTVYGDCAEACACIRAPSSVFVAASLPFDQMYYFPLAQYSGSGALCAVSGGMVVIDPSADWFAYGNNCTGRGFLTLLG